MDFRRQHAPRMNACHAISPANPGEVLACCGIAVLAARHQPEAITGFVRDGARTLFRTPDVDLHVIAESDHSESSILGLGDVDLDWWQPWGMNPEMKIWAGNMTAPKIVQNLLHALRPPSNAGWLDREEPVTGRLDVDPRGTWNALDLGWSINEHKEANMLCRPWVQLLAMVGLQEFPVRGNRQDGFMYSLWRPAPHLVARMAFAGHGHHVLADCLAKTDRNGSNSTLRLASVTWRDTHAELAGND